MSLPPHPPGPPPSSTSTPRLVIARLCLWSSGCQPHAECCVGITRHHQPQTIDPTAMQTTQAREQLLSPLRKMRNASVSSMQSDADPKHAKSDSSEHGMVGSGKLHACLGHYTEGIGHARCAGLLSLPASEVFCCMVMIALLAQCHRLHSCFPRAVPAGRRRHVPHLSGGLPKGWVDRQFVVEVRDRRRGKETVRCIGEFVALSRQLQTASLVGGKQSVFLLEKAITALGKSPPPLPPPFFLQRIPRSRSSVGTTTTCNASMHGWNGVRPAPSAAARRRSTRSCST